MVTITKEEKEELIGLQTKITTNLIELGENSYNIEEVNQTLETLKISKQDLVESQKQLNNDWDNLGKKLNSKYGEGNIIDVETGEVTKDVQTP